VRYGWASALLIVVGSEPRVLTWAQVTPGHTGNVTRADHGCRPWTAETGRGAPLIVCHGGPGLWDMFGSLADSLAGDVRVVRWDQRGCGPSPA